MEEPSDNDESMDEFESEMEEEVEPYDSENNAKDFDEFEENVETEKEVVEKLNRLCEMSSTEDVDQILESVKCVTDSLLIARFQDITNMFSDGEIFIVDGFSLILNAMADKNYDLNNGGQLLHLMYICERHLQLFTRKGGTFEVVFFNIWSRALSNNHTILLAKAALVQHLKYNMNCKVHELEAMWSKEFFDILQKNKCGFLLVDFQMTEKLQEVHPHKEHRSNYDLLFHVQMCYCLVGLYLGCVDMNGVELNVSTLNAFYCSPAARMEFKLIRKNLHNVISKLERSFDVASTSLERHNLNGESDNYDLRNYVTVVTAAKYLNNNNTHDDWINAFLIYSALLAVLPLKYRGCVKSSVKPTDEFIRFIGEIQKHMYNILQTTELNENFKFQNIPDLWHGNFFVKVVQRLACGDIMLGHQTLTVYEKLLDSVNKLAHVSLRNFSLIKYKSISEKLTEQQQFSEQFPIYWPAQLLPTSCRVTHEFCREILPEMLQNELYETLQNFVTRNQNFKENRHWHSLKPLTDEYDRIKDSERPKATNKKDEKYLQRMANKYAYYMSMYGSSVEGRPLSTKTIVCRNVETRKNKESKVGKASKIPLNSKNKKETKSSKQKIIEEKLKKDQLENEKLDRTLLKEFDSKYKHYMVKGLYDKALTDLKLVERRLKTDKGKIEMSLYEAKILWRLWKYECSENELPNRNLRHAKALFLLIRRILKVHEKIPLNDKECKQLAEYLYHLGLERIAEEWKLPVSVVKDHRLSVGKNWIEFQLLDLGPELEREVGKVPDSRVEGFIPDNWQKELFDYIDQKQSVLVVAPTSSGKTYASYYCIEEVLRDGNDGVVVYVAPTKALVNQVAATVYARFKNKTMPRGKSVYGVLTRDYRKNALNCQILVTVPQCLEVLLLSPRRHNWAKQLRYVIFDEVHCLAGQAGGFTWESGLSLIQCPFIALSATIEDPETLHKWLQKMQNFKKSRDITDGHVKPEDSYKVNLVIHQDRHADLKKYVFCEDGKFRHIHPYAYLDHEQVRMEGKISSSISLSPEEVHQLYKAMKSSNPDSSELNQIEPEIFFSSHVKGFLTRKSVRDYERELRKVLELWALNDCEMFKSITSKLNMVLEPLGESSETAFISLHFEEFIDSLIKEGKLPAILFSYNRGLVESLFDYATEYFEDIQNEIQSANKKKGAQKPEKEQKEPLGERGFRPKKLPLNILDTDGSLYNGVKEVGHADEKVVRHVEWQLRKAGFGQSHIFSRGLKMGVGMHHGGMVTKARSAVEMLFRMRVLNIVFATGTLALGVHMPCKSIAVIGDSLFLNPLQFQQMSGRAGRRGFDIEGNVVFMGLGERKMKRLVLGKLPKMIGNIPLSVSMVLRVLLYVNTVTSQGEECEDARTNALSRALAMLECCLVYESFPELRIQMKHFFAFATQLLILQGLLDDRGKPQSLTGIATHLYYHEPGNLAFIFLLKSRVLTRLCKSTNGVISQETQENLVLVLSYLFAPLKLHSKAADVKYNNSKVILPPLPAVVEQVLKEYNRQVLYLFDIYFRCVAEYCSRNLGEDNSLPLSGVRIEPETPFIPYTEGPMTLERRMVETCESRTVCSTFAALSGNTDRNLYSHNSTSNIRHQVFTDVKLVPVIELDVMYNGYAWDFYKHGVAAAIRRDNGLRQGEDFTRLQDFLLVLKCIETSLTELNPIGKEDQVLKTLIKVSTNFSKKFHKAYKL